MDAVMWRDAVEEAVDDPVELEAIGKRIEADSSLDAAARMSLLGAVDQYAGDLEREQEAVEVGGFDDDVASRELYEPEPDPEPAEERSVLETPLSVLEAGTQHFPAGTERGGQFRPRRGGDPGRRTARAVRKATPPARPPARSRSAEPAPAAKAKAAPASSGSLTAEKVEALFAGKAPAKAGELAPGIAYQGPGAGEDGKRRRAYTDEEGTLHLPEGFFKQSRETRRSVVLRHLGRTLADGLEDGEKQELADAGFPKSKDVVGAYLEINGPGGNAWREKHPDAAGVLERLAGERGLPLLKPPLSVKARPKRESESDRREALQEWREQGDPEDRAAAWEHLMAEAKDREDAQRAALEEALGPDLSAALADFREARISWANDEGLEESLISGDVTVDHLHELAEKELAEREGRRYDRLKTKETRGLTRRSFPCFVCGRFKAMPADVCSNCGDDPLTHHSTSKEIAAFNAAYGYESIGSRTDPTDFGGKGVAGR